MNYMMKYLNVCFPENADITCAHQPIKRHQKINLWNPSFFSRA